MSDGRKDDITQEPTLGCQYSTTIAARFLAFSLRKYCENMRDTAPTGAQAAKRALQAVRMLTVHSMCKVLAPLRLSHYYIQNSLSSVVALCMLALSTLSGGAIIGYVFLRRFSHAKYDPLSLSDGV
jgi:hypothetical protein